MARGGPPAAAPLRRGVRRPRGERHAGGRGRADAAPRGPGALRPGGRGPPLHGLRAARGPRRLQRPSVGRGLTVRPDITIVGAGINGLATAHALARDGRSVVVLEQFAVGNLRGSSHGASRVFRLSYAEEDDVRLALESLDGWRALEREAGEPLIVRTGSID